MKNRTKAIHTPYGRRDAWDALQIPVYNCMAYEFDDAAYMSDVFSGRVIVPDYSRVLNPTVMHLEERVAHLTGAKEVSAFNSGMAAISAMLFSTAAAGKNIVSSRHMFGNTYLLVSRTLARFGVEPRLVDLCNIEEVEKVVDKDTCCIFLESVTNPQTEVADTRALSEIAKKWGIPLIADTTMIPFTEFDGKAIGLDFQVVSSTKYISGGATSLGGLIIDYGNFPEISERIKKEAVFNLGGYMPAQSAYMQIIGLETLDARYQRQAKTAKEIAEFLKDLPEVKEVGYTGLESHPNYHLAKELYGDTSGAMVTFDLENIDACYNFLNNLKLIHRATNLFDNRSLAIHPHSTIFGTLSDAEKEEMDVKPTTIRLSIGLEDIEDLKEDLVQALKGKEMIKDGKI
ncbi:MAG: aminotransferase class I/II-fold pyridoxal phosphate-dependent enzyme [Muribaculaceae bacterium]|nr:aminotransferase class I/II-fold pyridoxal phosphate-dependent enzyme [Muribaculaceae bacterium]